MKQNSDEVSLISKDNDVNSGLCGGMSPDLGLTP